MAKSSITAFDVERVQEHTGFFGKRAVEDEMLRMETAGGAIYLRKSAVEAAGDNWKHFKRRLWNLAGEKGIPFEDHTVQD